MLSKTIILVVCSIMALGPGAYGAHTWCSQGGQDAAPERGQCDCPKDGPCKCSDSPVGLFCCMLPESRDQGLAELQAWKCLSHINSASTVFTDHNPVNYAIDIFLVSHPEHYGGNDIFLQIRSFRS